MGQTRQDVRRISDEMARDGIVEYLENPHHKRAKNMVLTPRGKEVCEQLSELQVPWAEEKSTGTRPKEMQATLDIVQLLVKRFET